MGIPDHLTCLLRNLYVGQEVRVRTPYGINDWFKAEKGVRQSYLLSPCLFDLYAEQIMRKAELDELQEGIKIGRRNINSLRYTDDTILMAESGEELKSLLMRVKEESERARLKLNNENNNNNKKNKDHGIFPHYFTENRGGQCGSSDRFPLLEL